MPVAQGSFFGYEVLDISDYILSYFKGYSLEVFVFLEISREEWFYEVFEGVEIALAKVSDFRIDLED